MKITAIKAWQVDLPIKEGRYSWSNGNFVDVFDATVVAVETDAGITGYAECCPLGSAYLPAYAAGVRAGLAEIGPKLIGLDPRDLGVLNRRMDAVLRGHAYAKAPVDVACWDILGKVAGLPVYRLLGGSEQPDIALYRAISQLPPDEMARNIAGYRKEGYTKFQLKVGADANDDIARIRACRKILEPGDILVADANTGWTMHEAARVVAAVRDVDVYIEQPCPSYEECLSIRRRTGLPFVLDEVITGTDVLVRGTRRPRDGRDQSQDLQGRRPHQGAADARSLRRFGHPDDDRGHVGRRHRHGGHRPSRALDAGRVLLLRDGFQQLRHGHDRGRRAAAGRRQDDGSRPAGPRHRAALRRPRRSRGRHRRPLNRKPGSAPFALPRSSTS